MQRPEAEPEVDVYRFANGRPVPWVRWVGRNLVVAAAYILFALFVRMYFSRYQMWPAPLWLPSGISMFAVLYYGQWIWPGIFVGSFLIDTVGFREQFALSLAVSCGNAFAPALSIRLIRARLKAKVVLSTVSDVLFFEVGVFLSASFSAVIGGTATWLTLAEPISSLPNRWLMWAASDAGAALLLTPLLLLLRTRAVELGEFFRRAPEFLLTTACCLAMAGYLLFGTSGVRAVDAGASFLILLPLLWLSVRFPLPLAYPMLVGVMGLVIALTLRGHGPFASVEAGATSYIFAHMAVGFGACLLLLGAASNEQRMAQEELRQLNLDLENKVERRTEMLKLSQDRLQRAALYDPLTSLPNRRLLEERFAFCEASAKRKNQSFGVLLIDLDFFKGINDNFGHDAGDAVLLETAHRLKASTRECDVVSRIGGDEFVVLLPETSDVGDIDAICQRITQMFRQPIEHAGNALYTSPSVGAALFPDHGMTWQLVYKAADIALYRSKHEGRGTWRWYEEESAAELIASRETGR